MTSASHPFLECRDLHVAYGGRPALFGVDLAVARGELLALVGTNGAGKSTLLRAISQLVAPSAGSILLDGADITRAGALEATRHGIVHVPGGAGTFPRLTVAEHFRVGSYLCPDRDVLAGRIADVVDGLFPRLRARWNIRAGELSGGERQQLTLAMALVTDPALLLIDELSLGLAQGVVAELLDVVRRVNASGCTVVVVEQSLEVAHRLASRAAFMDKGRIRFAGPTADLLERDDLVRPVFLPRPPSSAHAAVRATASGTALAVRSLAKHFGGVTAVDNVSFDVPDTAIVGLVGPNGAGKSTLADIVSGLVPPDRGTVLLGGRDVTRLPPHRRAQLGLGRSFQGGRLFPALTVAEAVAVAFECHLDVRDHVSSIVALPAAQAMEDDLAWRVDRLLEFLGLELHAEQPVAELSTGTRRVVELAMAMAHRPRVLLLDEPSAGLAQPEAEALIPLLLRLRDETGCSMLLIEHDIGLVSAVADEVIALDVGRIVDRGRPADVRAPVRSR